MLSVGFKTDKGMKREGNEDSVFVMPDKQLFMVADGVGGHSSGEIASRMAVESIASFFSERELPGEDDGHGLCDFMFDALDTANTRIYESANGNPSLSGMATTCVMCYFGKKRAYVVNVGDSRAYLVRSGAIIQVTEDHSCVQEMVRSGLITKEEARFRPDRNMITRALGGEKSVSPDFFSFTVYPGDTIILCTDGLYQEVEESRMVELCEKYKTMYKITRQLVDEANRHGGADNISVVCVRVQ